MGKDSARRRARPQTFRMDEPVAFDKDTETLIASFDVAQQCRAHSSVGPVIDELRERLILRAVGA